MIYSVLHGRAAGSADPGVKSCLCFFSNEWRRLRLTRVSKTEVDQRSAGFKLILHQLLANRITKITTPKINKYTEATSEYCLIGFFVSENSKFRNK